MIELTIGIILGGIISWFVTYIYYRKSTSEIPEWAKPIIDKLPPEQPSQEKLLELFQEALNNEEIIPDPILGHVACPECKTTASDFQEKSYGDDYHTIVVKTCPHCGWSEQVEV